jgi:hypothetical protein
MSTITDHVVLSTYNGVVNFVNRLIIAFTWWAYWYGAAFFTMYGIVFSFRHSTDVDGDYTGTHATPLTWVLLLLMFLIFFPGIRLTRRHVWRKLHPPVELAPLPPVTRTAPPTTIVTYKKPGVKPVLPIDYTGQHRARAIEEHSGYTVTDRRRFGHMLDD